MLDCPNLKHSILMHLFKLGLDMLRFETFENQKASHRMPSRLAHFVGTDVTKEGGTNLAGHDRLSIFLSLYEEVTFIWI
jgi:hypothetical protein